MIDSLIRKLSGGKELSDFARIISRRFEKKTRFGYRTTYMDKVEIVK
jgi:hypothetical protein